MDKNTFECYYVYLMILLTNGSQIYGRRQNESGVNCRVEVDSRDLKLDSNVLRCSVEGLLKYAPP